MAEAPRVPPRFVPTLTEVVKPVETGLPPEGRESAALRSGSDATSRREDLPSESELVQAVMRRVDAVLERRLQRLISSVVEAQTQVLAARLRNGIEAEVRRAVAEAVSAERAAGGSDPLA